MFDINISFWEEKQKEEKILRAKGSSTHTPKLYVLDWTDLIAFPYFENPLKPRTL